MCSKYYFLENNLKKHNVKKIAARKTKSCKAIFYKEQAFHLKKLEVTAQKLQTLKSGEGGLEKMELNKGGPREKMTPVD